MLVFSIRDNSGSVAFSPDGQPLGQRLGRCGMRTTARSSSASRPPRTLVAASPSAPMAIAWESFQCSAGQVTIYDATPLPEQP